MLDNYTTKFAVAAVVLCFAAILGGFSGFIAVLFFGALGAGVGAWLDGKLDLSEISRNFNGRGFKR